MANLSTSPVSHEGHFGPYHRLRSPTQTEADAARQAMSRELWGRASRYSQIPSVKAYKGALPFDAQGIEFETTVAPSPSSHPTNVWWYAGTSGVILRRQDNEDIAVIPIVITKRV